MSFDSLANIPSFDQAIARIEHLIRITKDVPDDFRVVPEPWSREIYETISVGIHTRDAMQKHLGIEYSELVDLLQIMVKLRLLVRAFNRENYNSVEYYIAPLEDGGTAGMPAVVPI
jgi:hypothetical protein